MSNLASYKAKRDFGKTTEPSDTSYVSKDKLSYVIQHHIASKDHYDLRLEWEGVMLSWAVPKGASFNPQDKRLSVRVEDHPIDYKDFEGNIPKGQYGGGVVMIWDKGFWQPIGDVNKGLQQGSLNFNIDGVRLKGKWALVRLDDDKSKQENWLLIKEKDEFARRNSGIEEFTTSVSTGRTISEIQDESTAKLAINPFNKANVQLAKLVTELPNGRDWVFELKYDGYRMLAFVQTNTARLITRNNLDYTKYFGDIADSLVRLTGGRAVVTDGEIVVADGQGKSDFSALQGYIKNHNGKTPAYIMFDILALDGRDLRDMPLVQRKQMLQDLLKDAPYSLRYSRHTDSADEAVMDTVCDKGMEGLVAKKADSPYSGTRNGDWVKIKCDNRQEFVIGGYTQSDKKTQGVSSLLLGVYDGSELIYMGRAGSGISEKTGKELQAKLDAVRSAKPHFANPPKQGGSERLFWAEPKLVAEIRFAELTADNLLRQASYKGLRSDKNPQQVVKEAADILYQPTEDGNTINDGISKQSNAESKQSKTASKQGNASNSKQSNAYGKQNKDSVKQNKDSVKQSNGNNNISPETVALATETLLNKIKITNPDRVVFEDKQITKLDVIRYYAQVSQRMMPYVGNRLLSVVRCPKGAVGECFFKKHPAASARDITTITVDTEGGKEEYYYIQSAVGLVQEAQMGTIEFHTGASRVDSLEHPDVMVLDLDPDEGVGLAQVRQGVRDIKSLLDELSLKSYLKTSGGKGYHIVVPFAPYESWEVFYDFAKKIAEVAESKWQDKYTSNSRKAKRTGKIFVDWMRNGRGATSVAPYSLRARNGAKVSMPIFWHELDTVAPNGIDMEAAIKRLRDKDPWQDFFTNKK